MPTSRRKKLMKLVPDDLKRELKEKEIAFIQKALFLREQLLNKLQELLTTDEVKNIQQIANTIKILNEETKNSQKELAELLQEKDFDSSSEVNSLDIEIPQEISNDFKI